MTGRQCFVCGFDNDHALEEHHIIPESLGGPDTDENTEWLCANCHRAISTMYSKWFFAKVWRIFESMETRPELVRQNPPKGLMYNDNSEFVPDREDGFEDVMKAYKLLDRGGPSFREISRRVGISNNTVRHLPEKRDMYAKFIEDGYGNANLGDFEDNAG